MKDLQAAFFAQAWSKSLGFPAYIESGALAGQDDHWYVIVELPTGSILVITNDMLVETSREEWFSAQAKYDHWIDLRARRSPGSNP